MRNGLQIDKSGNKLWYKDDLFHRENGPALEYVNGDKYWYQDGKLHRIDGPALEYTNGDKYWCIDGKYINCTTQEEFEKLLKLKAFW